MVQRPWLWSSGRLDPSSNILVHMLHTRRGGLFPDFTGQQSIYLSIFMSSKPATDLGASTIDFPRTIHEPRRKYKKIRILPFQPGPVLQSTPSSAPSSTLLALWSTTKPRPFVAHLHLVGSPGIGSSIPLGKPRLSG